MRAISAVADLVVYLTAIETILALVSSEKKRVKISLRKCIIHFTKSMGDMSLLLPTIGGGGIAFSGRSSVRPLTRVVMRIGLCVSPHFNLIFGLRSGTGHI